VVLAVVMLLVVVYLIAGLGVDAFLFAGVLALVPLVIVALGIRWIDRWDPEPRGVLVFSFLWGAGVAVLIALLVGAEVDNVVNSLGGPGPGYEFFGAAIQAPIVEETGKGLGLLVLFWVVRKHFDGPVDGIVYAATIAGGFAFTENILYFGQAVLEANTFSDLYSIFLLRGLMSPFAHVMFTACIGIALGIAASRKRAHAGVGYFLLGLVPAIALHALWNGSLFFVQNFFGYYAIVQLPLFIGAVFLVLYLRRAESRIAHKHLMSYAAAGWFNPAEVGSLSTAPGRRTAMAWARKRGSSKIMKKYIRDATRLAFARQRMIAGSGIAKAQADEAALLASIVTSRKALAGNSSV
jgi:RsiW-degrading membrane proteinase PrsW (M82 family)